MDEAESAEMANMAWFNAVLIVAFLVMNFAQPADAASWWLRSIVHDGVCSMAVPFFFLASGWFLGRHVDERHGVHDRAALVGVEILIADSDSDQHLHRVCKCRSENACCGPAVKSSKKASRSVPRGVFIAGD